MQLLKRTAVIPLAFALAFGALPLTGCDDGPAEDAGEKVDEAAKDAKRGVEDATD